MEIKKTTDIQLSYGAGSGNRTHLSSLEGWSITDIRYPHVWSGRRDSNPQHPPWQGGALPLSHFRICFLFILSGALCSLIDKIFYGGSLDFIGISNLFIADIKDLYINLGLFFFIVLIYKEDFLNDDNNTTFKDDLKSIKRFLVFVKNDIFRKEKKEKA